MSNTFSTRTICCKVQFDSGADTALRQTQQAFNRATTYCASVAWDQTITAPLRFLERQGYIMTVLPVDSDGLVDPAHLAAAITDQTILVSIMHANNEVRTIQPIRAIADIAHARGVLVHTDAVQTIGKLPISVDDLG